MPSNKSPGPDKINMRVIKDCLHVILEPLTSIINHSLTTSEFPDAWKIAELIPLLKEGDHEVPSNNRPLSLLNVASKVCERVLKCREHEFTMVEFFLQRFPDNLEMSVEEQEKLQEQFIDYQLLSNDNIPQHVWNDATVKTDEDGTACLF